MWRGDRRYPQVGSDADTVSHSVSVQFSDTRQDAYTHRRCSRVANSGTPRFTFTAARRTVYDFFRGSEPNGLAGKC
jgi:hypothetical protein